MRIQYAAFCLLVTESSVEQEALNRFLRGHRVIQTWKELVTTSQGPSWSILVEYGEAAASEAGQKGKAGQPRIDYKEVLSPEDFKIYSGLRELRKSLAEDKGLPVYAVFTNDQLAALSRSRPTTIAELTALEGIGQGKSGQFGEAFIARIGELANAPGGTPF
jgi:superfamily II DNA helicase RecQ